MTPPGGLRAVSVSPPGFPDPPHPRRDPCSGPGSPIAATCPVGPGLRTPGAGQRAVQTPVGGSQGIGCLTFSFDFSMTCSASINLKSALAKDRARSLSSKWETPQAAPPLPRRWSWAPRVAGWIAFSFNRIERYSLNISPAEPWMPRS